MVNVHGTCRLPYELIENEIANNNNNSTFQISNNEKILDKGYLLSTKDLCGLEYLPRLVKSGVICFKIEGRMKSPEYVATVTRIYRKYLDKILNDEEYIIDRKDITDLELAFNRGGFSNGFLDEEANTNLVFKDKPNHMGIYLGKINKFNPNKGYITLKLGYTLSVGDKIAIDNNGVSNNYTISEIMINNVNTRTALPQNVVTIGRMKGNISIGNKIYLVESKNLVELSTNSYQNVENHTIDIDCMLEIITNKQIKISAKIVSESFNNIQCEIITNIIPEKAKNAPITKEKITEQFNKTKNTIFRFNNLNINLDNNIFLTISTINELRRILLIELENRLTQNIKRTLDNEIIDIKQYINPLTTKLKPTISSNKPKISVLLNILKDDFNYLNLKNLDRLYIPLKYFVMPKFRTIIINLSKTFNVYIYMPTIMRKNYTNLLNLNLKIIFNTFDIKGVVISNIGQLSWFKDYNLDIIGNYTLNVFNNITIDYLEKLNISSFTLSPELDKETILTLNKFNLNNELIVYGKTPVMNSNYCALGKSNKCHKNCPKYCNELDKCFYLKDRLNLKFRVIPDNIDTISTIYNSKITSILWKDYNVNNLRIDILDENISDINCIISKVLNNERFEGKEYTNGNLNREI